LGDKDDKGGYGKVLEKIRRDNEHKFF